ncbi:MAG: response regulator transcription factor [Steroidobacteraceae bacterium]|nr:response regulator transcription factor [Steroidobacteraceae bacterium]
MDLLLVEDDLEAAALLKAVLEDRGHTVQHVGCGEDGVARACANPFDVLIADRLLPGMDGLTLIREIRARGVGTPVLVLSSLGEVDDRVAGLQAGGDDYLVKPYHTDELLARVEVLARRSAQGVTGTHLTVGDLELDLLRREVHRAGRRINLTPREFRLLEFLMRYAGQVVTRRMLLENVWGYTFDPGTNIIDVHVSRLRTALDDDRSAPMLQTVRGQGYVLLSPEGGRVDEGGAGRGLSLQ